MVTIPTINQLYTSILGDLQTQYGATISPVGKSVLRALAAVQAAKIKLYYLLLGKLQKNIFVDTADPEALGGTLERFGRVKLGRNPFPAVAAQYSIRLNGEAGAIIPQSTTFKSDDDSLNPGMLFILDQAYEMATAFDTITVRALTSGTASKLSNGDTLTATSPIGLVNSSVTVIAEVVEPLAAEDIEEYRAEILSSFRLSPQGGAKVDYRLWAQDAQGVAQIYPYATDGNKNEVDIYVEANVADSIDTKGTPSQALLDSVANVIELNPDSTIAILKRGRRPLGVWQVNVFPITAQPLTITIVGFQGLTPEIKSQINAAIIAGINSIRPYVDGADVAALKNDILDLNKIIGFIINSQPGAVFTSVAFTVNGISYSTYTFNLGNIPFISSSNINYV